MTGSLFIVGEGRGGFVSGCPMRCTYNGGWCSQFNIERMYAGHLREPSTNRLSIPERYKRENALNKIKL